MIQLFLALVDRLIMLAKHRKESNRELYSDYVAPAFRDFEAVHAGYIDHMRKYRNMLADERHQMTAEHPIFTELALDSIQTAHFRAKLAELFDPRIDFRDKSFVSFPSSAPRIVDNFVHAVHHYMHLLPQTDEVLAVDDRSGSPDESGELLASELEKGIRRHNHFMADLGNLQFAPVRDTRIVSQQVIRELMYRRLKSVMRADICDALKRQFSVSVVDLLTAIIQRNCEPVIREHGALKKTLLGR